MFHYFSVGVSQQSLLQNEVVELKSKLENLQEQVQIGYKNQMDQIMTQFKEIPETIVSTLSQRLP